MAIAFLILPTTDGDDDHELQKGKTLSLWERPGSRSAVPSSRWREGYHSLYFVPSNAVPCDFVYTSKTFWPPQELFLGSS